MNQQVWRYPKRPKLALTYSWPMFVPHPERWSDVPIAPDPAGDNITRWTPYGGSTVYALPDSHIPNERPWVGAYDVPEITNFGPSGIGVAAGAIGPVNPDYHEKPYLGLPSPLWRPFQPQPAAYLVPPKPFAQTAQELNAAGARR